MDALQFLSSRTIDINAIFAINEQATAQSNINGVLTALGNVLEKLVRTWWDICTFEQYIKEKILVRSSRWEVAPQDGLDDPESMQEWYEFFTNMGFKLQDLVLARKRKKMSILEGKINEFRLQLEPVKGTQQVLEFNTRIKKKLEKIDRDTQKKKSKKFHRDLNDFRSNSVYVWQQAKIPVSGSNNTVGASVDGLNNRTTKPPNMGTQAGGNKKLERSSCPVGTSATPIRGEATYGGRNDRINGPYQPYNYSPSGNNYQVPVYNRFDPLRGNGE